MGESDKHPYTQKGNLDAVDNYRGASLLRIVSKCYTSILNQRLTKWLQKENKIVQNQAARISAEILNIIFTLYAVAQKYMCKKGRRLYVAFADFKKAFDSVHHGQLLETSGSGHQGHIL